MNLKPSILALAAIAAVTPPATAQERPKPAPVNQEQALAEAQRLVRDGQADGIFTAAADAGGPLARHARSGLVCHFEFDGRANNITVFDKGPARGNDVGCATRFREIVVTLYVNRVADIGDVARAQAGQINAIRTRYPDAKPYVGEVASVAAAGGPAITANRFEIAVEGRSTFTRAASMRMGDWIVTERISAPMAAALPADILGGLLLVNAAKEAGSK